jgi:hypothetical protein
MSRNARGRNVKDRSTNTSVIAFTEEQPSTRRVWWDYADLAWLLTWTGL